jgi:hypothetical protein
MTQRLTRRVLLTRGLTLAGSAAIGVPAWISATAAAKRSPIKIGLIAPQTGGFSQNGRDMINALLLCPEGGRQQCVGARDSSVHRGRSRDTRSVLDQSTQTGRARQGRCAGEPPDVELRLCAPRLPGPKRGNPIDVYVRRVDIVKGQPQNTVIFTYKQVSQFWTFAPEEYLKRPSYTRDYPPPHP